MQYESKSILHLFFALRLEGFQSIIDHFLNSRNQRCRNAERDDPGWFGVFLGPMGGAGFGHWGKAKPRW